ncbi:MAG TPA: S-adenosylmethionine:tRNA ribosyltransferase-isomerase, partial [Chitinophagales bacterium]|nr:S-adenosylmethionine:tRNA ribosyltransferase-isomerase [Chitinophagales bacterium]
MNPRQIAIKDYTYQLPDERIAHYPLPERDASKLLVYKNGHISEDTYRNLNNYLPDNTTLWFNNTRVIPARLFFTTQTGAKVEIFCLEPLQHTDISAAMLQTGATQWNC